ncbi:MAG TPA: NHLP family bacteriocin export ABC transporter peptidase/permease/ATPase subunit [Opitutaceae bacterium]
MNAAPSQPPLVERRRTPPVLQMEAIECGAAALGSILEYHGRYVPLAELRLACGISRDGSKAVNIVRAARTYGLEAKGFRKEDLGGLATLPFPLIVFWNFKHFLVVEGIGGDRVFLNDPACGPRSVTFAQFDEAFTGVALTFKPTAEFKREGQRPEAWRALRERLRGCERPLLFILLVSLALVIPGLVIPVFSQVFVDEFLVRGRTDWLTPLLAGMAATALLRAALTWLQQHYLLRFETKLAISSASRCFWHILRLPVNFFTQRYAGEVGHRVGLNDQVATLLSGQLATHAFGLVAMAVYALVMLNYSVLLTLLGVGLAAANLAVLYVISQKRTDDNQRLLQESGQVAGATMSGLQMIETIKATAGESDFFARWSGFQARVLNAQQALGATTHLLAAVPPLLTALNHAAVLGFGGYLVMEGRLTLGMLVAFQSLMASFIEPSNRLVVLGTLLQKIQGSLVRLGDVLDHRLDPVLTQPEPAPTPGVRAQLKLTGELELRDVTFGYSRLDPPLLRNFSLHLRPGARIALVGRTGCGKSTVARLVSGLYEPWQGEILFDGRPRAGIPRTVLASSLALVDQEVFLFEGSARENLTLWDSTAPDASVVRAAKDACIHDEIAGRNGGYDCRIEESGRNFSGGQRQRLEIARALVNQPTLLLFDEATSALDTITEKLIDTHLRRRGCACLIVAHRLSTIRDCDEIVVMDQGQIVQRGTHEELSAKPGLYAELLHHA